MQPIAKSYDLAAQAFQMIRDAIAEGHYPPGHALNQDAIAADLGVSRQPVSQAIQMLKIQGFVSEEAKRRTVVAPLDKDRMKQTYQLRGVLDGLAGSLAAGKLSPKVMNQAQKLITAGREAFAAKDVKAAIEADLRFHMFIYRASKNPIIFETLEPHWYHLRRIMGNVIEGEGFPDGPWNEHQLILDAIAAGDADKAEALSREHAGHAASRLAHYLERSQ